MFHALCPNHNPMENTMNRMSRRILMSFALGAALPLIASAQATSAKPADPAMAALSAQWSGTIKYITSAAEEMTEANYAFKPVATVRSFGELIGHVAGSQHMICAAALGEPQPPEDAVEKSAKTKAALLTALKESTEHCRKAYAISPANGAMSVKLFGGDNTRVGALALNAVHIGEHYGNIITYMRMKGLVPPSSK
jgi:uncharacterized damage-inducible protein DinB